MNAPATKDFYWGWLFGTALTAGLVVVAIVVGLGLAYVGR